IVIRRSRPVLALALAVAASAAMPDNRTLVLPIMVVLYTIASDSPWRASAQAGSAAALVTIAAGAAWGTDAASAHGGLIGYSIGDVASCAAAVAVGLYVAARRRVIESLRDRAVAQERLRIAQELHDVVAHNVSLMVVNAQALGATAGDPQVTAGTDVIADLGRQTMQEMHATLRLLRSGNGGEPELAPQPGLGQLERLLEQSRGAGLEIELTVEGRPRQLAKGLDLSAFRIVQEALTNVVKHAAGARTKVTLAYGDACLLLTVTDRADDARSAVTSSPSDGHGLIGMRERAVMFGGTLSTEALPYGFRVTAMLPYVPTAT
nr:histidine kinase [Actinomycetota bacterium]